MQVKFTDPKTGDTYSWPINPGWDGITQGAQKQRAIERTSNTGNVGATKQQGDDGPYVIHWEPEIFSADHEKNMWVWWELCQKQSINLTDWNDEECEGQIITLSRQQIGAAGGPGDTNQRLFYAKYVFEFEVWAFVTGLMADAGVTP